MDDLDLDENEARWELEGISSHDTPTATNPEHGWGTWWGEDGEEVELRWTSARGRLLALSAPGTIGALIAHARDLRAEVERLNRLLDTADSLRADMQAEAGRQEARADLAEAEIERLHAQVGAGDEKLAERYRDMQEALGVNDKLHGWAGMVRRIARMRAVVEAADRLMRYMHCATCECHRPPACEWCVGESERLADLTRCLLALSGEVES